MNDPIPDIRISNMFAYKLSYIDLSYQERRIIILDRTDRQTGITERIRASQEDQQHNSGVMNYLNYYAAISDEVARESTKGNCYYSEELLGAQRVNKRTKELHAKIFALIQKTYPEWPIIVKTTFMGRDVNRDGGLAEMCDYLEITDPQDTQKQIIDQLFVEAAICT